MLSKRQIKLAIRNGSEEKLYEQLVTGLIRTKYSQHQVEAIINNYLDEPTNEKYLNEFTELQTFRKQCKAQAKTLINEVKTNI